MIKIPFCVSVFNPILKREFMVALLSQWFSIGIYKHERKYIKKYVVTNYKYFLLKLKYKILV